MTTKVLFKNGLQAAYSQLSTKDTSTFYFTTDDKNLYLGDTLISNKLTDATFTDGILTISKNDGSLVKLDFSDFASAEKTGAAIVQAIATSKSQIIGSSDDTKDEDTVYGAKAFATDLVNINSASTLAAAKDYTDTAVEGVSDTLSTLRIEFDTLVGSDEASGAIDTFNEIKDFLAGVGDDPLADMISTINAGLDNKVDKVDNSRLMTDAEGVKLSNIEAGAQVNTVTSVAGREGDVVLTKTDVGLSNVDNTSDLLKPISTATQNALNLKVDAIEVVGDANGSAEIVGTTLKITIDDQVGSLGDDVKSDLIGSADDTKDSDTIYGAKAFAVDKSSSTLTDAKDYTDTQIEANSLTWMEF